MPDCACRCQVPIGIRYTSRAPFTAKTLASCLSFLLMTFTYDLDVRYKLYHRSLRRMSNAPILSESIMTLPLIRGCKSGATVGATSNRTTHEGRFFVKRDWPGAGIERNIKPVQLPTVPDMQYIGTCSSCPVVPCGASNVTHVGRRKGLRRD
jgi:hypothetical protein